MRATADLVARDAGDDLEDTELAVHAAKARNRAYEASPDARRCR